MSVRRNTAQGGSIEINNAYINADEKLDFNYTVLYSRPPRFVWNKNSATPARWNPMNENDHSH